MLAAPRSVAPYWPWPLAAPFVAQYAPLFVAWGAAAWLVARERRRYVRTPVLCGLLSWAVGVLLASLWHVAAFTLSNPLTWLWFAAFAALAVLSAHRLWPLWPLWPARLRKALGRQSRDSGTRLPPQ